MTHLFISLKLMEVNKRARLVELECNEKWRHYWHSCDCYTIGDVLAIEPDNLEALGHLAHLMRFELRYKRDLKFQVKGG